MGIETGRNQQEPTMYSWMDMHIGSYKNGDSLPLLNVMQMYQSCT